MYSAHFAVTWFQHGFGQEELFNWLYAHTYTKSLYTKLILYLWFIFNFETPQVLKVYSAVKVYSSVKNSGNERPYLPDAIWMTNTSFEIWNIERCAIYSRDTAIRISSVPRFRRKNPFVKISPLAKLWASQNIFAGLPNIGFSKYGHILGKPLCSGPMRRPGRQAHGGTALARRHHVRCP